MTGLPSGIPVLHEITGTTERCSVRPADGGFRITAHLGDGRGLVRLVATRSALLDLIQQSASALREPVE